MQVFHGRTCNKDRHFANFGLMVDSRANRPCSFAPLFDHGLSLLNCGMRDDFENPDACAKTRLSAYHVPFENIVRAFCSARQREKLRRMSDFSFAQDRTYHLPAWREKALEAWLRRRAGELIGLSLQS